MPGERESESSALFEWKEEPWSLLFEISHIGRLRDHADRKPMFQLFTQVNNLLASRINISKRRKKEMLWTFSLSVPRFKPRTYKTAIQHATIRPCRLSISVQALTSLVLNCAYYFLCSNRWICHNSQVTWPNLRPHYKVLFMCFIISHYLLFLSSFFVTESTPVRAGQSAVGVHLWTT